MEILIINGSPRKGNTKFALNIIRDAIKEKYQDANYEILDATTLNIIACINCNTCKKNGGNCIHKDDTVMAMNKMMKADILIFGTPVYWWGMSGQLKVFIDKFYSKDGFIQESTSKKVGVLTFGAAESTDIQYRLITDQFKNICNFLEWDLIFSEGFSCYEKDDLMNNMEQQNEVVKVLERI